MANKKEISNKTAGFWAFGSIFIILSASLLWGITFGDSYMFSIAVLLLGCFMCMTACLRLQYYKC